MLDFSKAKLDKIAEEYGLADVYLFGSRINGFQREESDLDVGVRFKKGLPDAGKRAKIYGNLFSDLTTCFSGQKIDLVFIEEAPLHFQFKIINEGEMIYSLDRNDSANFVEKTVNHYRDQKYFIDLFYQGVLETVGN